MAKIAVVLFMLFYSAACLAADSTVAGLTADASPTDDDLIYVVNDPGGTPADRKVTLGNAITKAHGLSDGVLQVSSGAMDNIASGGNHYFFKSAADNGSLIFASPEDSLSALMTFASQAEMEEGTETAIRSMSPLRVAQAIAALAGSGTGDLLADGTVPLTADWNVGDYTITAKGFSAAKTSGVAGDIGLYEANSTDVDAAGFRGPSSMTGDTSYRLQLPSAGPTEDGMSITFSGTAASGSGTPAAPYVYAGSFTSQKLPIIVNSDTNSYSVTAAQMAAGTFFITTNAATTTYVLPAAAAGYAACFRMGQGNAQVLRIDTDGTDYIVKSTGARTSSAGDYYGATSSAANQVCVVAFNATDYYVTSETGTWTEE